MAFTTPVTWVDGTTPAAADFNAQIRDNIRYLKGLDGVPYIENPIELPESATPATPASGRGRFYPKSDGHFYGLNDSGVERIMTIVRGMGTAFPTSPAPATDDLFYRTDLGLLCYYDGTRWLTVHEYTQTLSQAPNIANPKTDATYTLNQSILFGPSRQDYGIYYTKAYVWLFVATTNNGSNYWEVEITNTGTSLAIFSTAADAANTNLYKANTTPVVLAASRQYWQLRTSNNVGTPGDLSYQAIVFYRLIIT